MKRENNIKKENNTKRENNMKKENNTKRENKFKPLKLKTKRLLIETASLAEMEQLRDEAQDAERKKAYQEMIDGCQENPKQYNWYAAWKIMDRTSGELIGEFCFKGPQKDGAVEIEYGIKPAFEKQGYMSEAVKVMCGWATSQEDVYFIMAKTTEENAASKRVLEKNKFKPVETNGEEGLRFFLERESSVWMPIYMSFGLCIGMSLGMSQGNQSLGMCLGMSVGLAIGAAMDASDKKRRDGFRQKLGLTESKGK